METLIFFTLLMVCAASVVYILAQAAKAFKVSDTSEHEHVPEQNVMSQGYIFCSLWHEKDIHRIASDMSVVLSKNDVLAVISNIKRSFNEERGITRAVIQAAINDYIERRARIIEAFEKVKVY